MAPRMSWHAYLIGLAGICTYMHLRVDGIAPYYGIRSAAEDPTSLAWAAGLYTVLFLAVKFATWLGDRGSRRDQKQ